MMWFGAGGSRRATGSTVEPGEHEAVAIAEVADHRLIESRRTMWTEGLLAPTGGQDA